MPSHGIIYQALSPVKRFLYHIARGVGAGLVAFAIVGVIFSYYPIVSDEISYNLGEKTTPVSRFGDLIKSTSAESLGLDPYFSIYVPKIDAKARVLPNINPGNPYEYNYALGEGVAHARGTNFPGQGKLIYLFSHSTDSPLNFAQYNAVFYLLRKLEKGDRITVFFLGKEYNYTVTQKLITAADDTSWLRDSGQGETLVLQTCDPPGTSINRLLIIAKP